HCAHGVAPACARHSCHLRSKHFLLLVTWILLAGCASDDARMTPSGPYKAGAHNYTVDGRPVVCDTAGVIGRSVTRCF
ncbi:MAG: hypothetical protein AB7V59_12625, partial [Gammaproteobacteria bacterium]